ncbi:hypothetical protein KDA14_04725 [Candidatus Saccharibacteria bacterium]|nr:hypothetical protein [Candidatus Saccharibacteria bacterium]
MATADGDLTSDECESFCTTEGPMVPDNDLVEDRTRRTTMMKEIHAAVRLATYVTASVASLWHTETWRVLTIPAVVPPAIQTSRNTTISHGGILATRSDDNHAQPVGMSGSELCRWVANRLDASKRLASSTKQLSRILIAIQPKSVSDIADDAETLENISSIVCDTCLSVMQHHRRTPVLTFKKLMRRLQLRLSWYPEKYIRTSSHVDETLQQYSGKHVIELIAEIIL